MIQGGIATVMVSNFDRAVDFYSNTLNLKLVCRAGNEWAEVDAGGFKIGLHLEGHGPKAGTPGAVSIGFNLTVSIEKAVAALKDRGVIFRGDILDNEKDPVKLAFFGDPDGNSLYLCEQKKS